MSSSVLTRQWENGNLQIFKLRKLSRFPSKIPDLVSW